VMVVERLVKSPADFQPFWGTRQAWSC